MSKKSLIIGLSVETAPPPPLSDVTRLKNQPGPSLTLSRCPCCCKKKAKPLGIHRQGVSKSSPKPPGGHSGWGKGEGTAVDGETTGAAFETVWVLDEVLRW